MSGHWRALAVAFACFAAYACVILLSSPESDVNAFFTLWLYQGLILLSVVIAGARAVLVKKDRLAWTVVAISLACTSFAELYFIAVEPESYPSIVRLRLDRLLPRRVRGHGPPHPTACTLDRRSALARRRDRVGGSRRGRQPPCSSSSS